jgi:hypothetical protein
MADGYLGRLEHLLQATQGFHQVGLPQKYLRERVDSN